MIVKQKKRNLLSQNAGSLLHSIKYDLQFLRSSYPNSLKDKLNLISNKYHLLLKHFILNQPIMLGKSSIKLNNQNFYYETSLGISGLLKMIVDFERYYLSYIKDLIEPTIIDVGAHLGSFSLTASRFFPQAQIFACEPVQITFELLKKNCNKTKSIKPIKLALSDKKIKDKIYFVRNKLAFSSLFSDRFLWSNNPKSQSVQLNTLDNFIANRKINKIDILKIDAEGSEEKILKGASQALSKTRFLIIECALDQVGGTTFSSLISHLHSPNFNFQLRNLSNIMFNPQNELSVVDLLLENIQAK